VRRAAATGIGGSQQELFDAFAAPLIGMPVAHAWQGHGSAVFLEFGALTARSRLDGTPGQPHGEMGLMIEWSWRVEGRRSILWGSWTDQARWSRGLACLAKGTVADVTVFARLPELDLALSTGLHASGAAASAWKADPDLGFRMGSGRRSG
jgi:hypothetical protein